MSLLVLSYFIYLLLSSALTIWVAHTLHKNGRVFLVDAFHGNEPMADSVNHLLVVGFYLVNLGYVCLVLKIGYAVVDAASSIEVLSKKLGGVLLVLGVMHFFNLLLLSVVRATGKHRSSAERYVAPLPVAPRAPAAS